MSKKIAFIKFCGMAAGGTEKHLQSIAKILVKNSYEVDYFYTVNCPFTDGYHHPDNDEFLLKQCQEAGVNTIKVNVEGRVGGRDELPWTNTNLWELFDENKYDAVVIGNRGVEEYPYNAIKKTKVVNIQNGIYTFDQTNFFKQSLISRWQADLWIKNGGDSNKLVIIPVVVETPVKKLPTVRNKLGISENTFVYGFHQRNSESIFSPLSLEAYKQIENENNYFLLLGGSSRHREYAKQLNIKNIKFIEHNSTPENIHDFLSSLNVYTHARSDGEICSLAIIEALSNDLPVITHTAGNMGQVEQVEGCGFVENNANDYANRMKQLETDKNLYNEYVAKSNWKYNNFYSYEKVKSDILNLFSQL
jgi:glycosyltransferase involved in cell wall biosynthesis